MATFRICDMCGEPIAKGESVYKLTSMREGPTYRLTSTRERGVPIVQQQQLCLNEEIHERCMRKLVGYYRAYQRGAQ